MTDGGGEGPSYDDDTAQAVCGCAYEEITSPTGITYERFRQINDSQEAEPSELPQELRETIDRCRTPDVERNGG